MAFEYFLEVSGLSGSSTAVGREGAFRVTVEDLQASNTATSGGSGAGAGKAAISALTVGVADETGLTDFLRLVSTGGHVAAASLIAQVTGAGGGVEAYRLNLADVVVTGVHETEAGGYQVELAFAQMGLLTRDQNPDGSFDPAEGFGFNLLTNTFVPPPADADPGAPVGATAADHYFLLIDGVNGGSSQVGHAGWFDLPHFDFDVDALISATSGVGVTHFGPITLDLPNLGGLTTLIGDSLTGAVRAGLRIEGADSQGHVHYSLDLADLFIKSVQESDGAGYRVTLDYGRIKLTTVPQDAAGGLGAPQTFSWDVSADKADVGVLPTIAPAASALGPPSGAGDYILEVAGLRGPSVLAGAEGGFHVTSFAFDVGNSGDLPGAGGAGVGKATASGLTLHFADETGVADFLKLAANGQHLAAASLTAHSGGGGAQEVYRVNLANVIVTSVQEDEGHGFSVQLAFGEIGVEVQGQAADGSFSPLGSVGYDLLGAKVEAVPADAVSGPAIGSTGAAHYFLLVDGVNGGATQAGHVGWFDLGDFDVHVTDAATLGGAGGGAGKASFSDLSVDVSNLGGFTQLLAKLATGGAIPGVRVEGVNGAGDVSYRLDLADVFVRGIHENEGASGYSAAFSYGRVALTPFAQQPDGSLDPGTAFTWNLAANSPAIGSLPAIAPASGALAPPVEGDAFFLAVSGLSGDATAAGAQGAFKVVDFGFDASATTSGSGGAGGGVGVAHFGPVHVTLADEAGLADFLKLVAGGQHVAAASITGLRAGGGEVYRLNLADVTVTDVHETQGHGYEVTLAYRTIGVLAHPQNPDGSVAPAQTFGFDTVAHATVAPPADAAPGPAIGPSGANSYVLLIDGVAGDSVVAHHAGWFDLASFDLDVQGLIAAGGSGGGAGSSDFGPLSVHLPGFTGLDDLFRDLISGRHIAGLRIEGLTAGQSTYQLDLADVVVTQVRDDQAGGYDVQFDYGRIRVVGDVQQPDGTIHPGTTFAWNVAANSPDIGALPPISPSGGNQAPIGAADGPVAVNEDASTANLYDQLLANDTDPNPVDSLTISAVDTAGTKGSVAFDAATHTLTYAADADAFDLLATGASVTDTFRYTVRDAAGLTSTATVTMRVTGAADGVVIVGENKADTLTGSTGEDSIRGGNGADQINGAGGADTITGENGDDVIHGGASIDLLFGDNGDDQLFGDLGDDTLQGDAGSDRLSGGAGDDRFVFVGGASTQAQVDRILDFTHGDKVVLQGGLSIFATQVRDFDGDGHLDTVHILSNTQTLVLLGFTGWSAGDFIVG